MFVYILIASTMISMVPGGRFIVVIVSFSTFESLKYAGMSASTYWNLMSVHTRMECIRLPFHEMTGIMTHGVLWNLIIP